MNLETLEIFQSLDILFFIFIFIIGLCLGSFINSWMWRIRDNCRITNGRSVCIHCRRQLSWYENIPLLSYLFLGGRCGSCHKKIPIFYAVTEAMLAILLVLIFIYHVNLLGRQQLYSEWHVSRDVFFLTILAITFMYDYLYGEVLVRMIFMGIVIGFGINYIPLHYSGYSLLIGVAAGAGFFLLQYLVSRGRWIGGGDIWIGAMMGAWLGWPQVLLAIFLAYMLGAGAAVILLISGRKKIGSAVPFGVFLTTATLFTL